MHYHHGTLPYEDACVRVPFTYAITELLQSVSPPKPKLKIVQTVIAFDFHFYGRSEQQNQFILKTHGHTHNLAIQYSLHTHPDSLKKRKKIPSNVSQNVVSLYTPSEKSKQEIGVVILPLFIILDNKLFTVKTHMCSIHRLQITQSDQSQKLPPTNYTLQHPKDIVSLSMTNM